MSESKGAGDARHIRVPSSSPSRKPTGNASATGKQPPIAFTRFDAVGDTPLTKRFALDPAGTIKKISQTQLYRGIAHRTEIPSLDSLPAFLDGLTYQQCISAGVYDLPACEIVLDREITEEMITQGKRSRTKRFLKSPQHALALFDHDPGPYTPESQRCATPTALMDMLEQFIPELRGVAYVGAGSSSAGVYNEATSERYPSTGIHLYISTVGIDPAALARSIEVRAWNAGYGYITLSANGSMLPRCPVDLAVFAPERLVYEAQPLLDSGIARDPREWSSRPGSALLHIPDSTPEEIAECKRRITAAMQDPELVRKAIVLRDAHYGECVERLARTKGITVDEARERLPKPAADANGDVRYLAEDYVLEIKGERITVDELIARGQEFHQCAMPDPIEGSAYGTSTAKFYFDERNGGIIHSLAHGRKTTYMLLDFAPCEYVQVLAPSLSDPLPTGVFPHRGKTGPLGTIENVRALLDGYGIRVRYEVISKRLVISIPGHSGTPDNLDNSTLATIFSVATLNRIPTGNLPQYLAAIGDRNPVNPVADWIERTPWDGVDRLTPFYATLTTREDFPIELKKVLLLRWLISVVAAALMPSGFRCRGVLVLCGPQAIGKGAWIIALIDDPMLRAVAIKVDHHLDPSNKDSILGAICHLIVELAELEGTFKRKDIALLKGFITSDKDKVRRPYDRRESEYQRRTVFVASVNQPDFLVDDTGNTRWWTLPVVEVDYTHGIDMQQLWAQAATLYRAGEQWWLTRDEEQLLERYNQQHRSASAIRDAILEQLDCDAPKDKWERQTARQVLITLGYHQPTNPLTREGGAILREMFGEPTRSQGMSRWLVPPGKQSEIGARLGGYR